MMGDIVGLEIPVLSIRQNVPISPGANHGGVPASTMIAAATFNEQKAVTLNHRPRKRLGYRTPYEVFDEALLALDM